MRIGGHTGLGPGGQAVTGMLAYAEQAVAGGDASAQTWEAADDGVLRVPAGTVCMSCFRTMNGREAARRAPLGWRHECCPS